MTPIPSALRLLFVGSVLMVFAVMSVHAAELEIVKEGRALQLLHPDPAFEVSSDGGCVILTDPKETFVVNARPGDQFTLKIRMAIEKAEGSAASLVLNHGADSSNFIFSGAAGQNKEMHAAGRALGKSTAEDIKTRPAPPFVLGGEMFDLQLTCRKTGEGTADLAISLNGEPIVQQSGKCPVIDSIGLRPWRGTMRIESMTLEGASGPGGVEAKFYVPKER